MSETIISKTCYVCKETKPIFEFHIDRSRKGGHRHNCKACQKKYRQSEKGNAAHARYQNTEKSKIAQRRFRARHPGYHKAGKAVNNAIRDKKLPQLSSLRCHDCVAQAQQYHHHKGYEPEHQLDVIPVCIPCHKKLHS